MPRQVDHQQRRTEIAYAVWAVIAEHGLDALTLRQVATEAGISLGRVQHYFASKDDLLRYACRTVIEVAATSFADRIAGADGSAGADDHGAIEIVRALVAQPVPHDQRSRAAAVVWQAFLTRAMTDGGLGAIIGDAVRGTQQELARLIERAQCDGELEPTLEPATLGAALFALGYGLAQQVLISGTTTDQALAAIDLTLAGLRPH